MIKLKVGVPHFEIEIEMKPPVPGATTQSITLVQIYIYILQVTSTSKICGKLA